MFDHLLADLYYGGDTFSVEQPQSFTCPYCGKMGFTETSLQEHVTSEHSETSTEVVSTLTAQTELLSTLLCTIISLEMSSFLLSILVYLCYPLACSEFSHHCNSQLLHFSYSVAFYEHSPLLSKARQRLRLLILLTPGCLVGCLTNSYLRAGVKRCHWSVWPELTYYLT